MGKLFVSYIRVSTRKQQESGLGLEAQQSAVRAFVASQNGRILTEFREAESGKRADRPQLDAALAACRRHKATLVIAKLDRLARNLHFLSGLMESGVDFIACDNPTATRLTVHILAAVAEDEARRISDRTKAALAAAKARGTRLGGCRWNLGEISAKAAQVSATVRRERADAWAVDLRPVVEELRAAGIATLAGMAEQLNARGMPTPRVGRWHASSVANLLRRLEAIA